MNTPQLRAMTTALGAGSVLFGIPPLLAPRFCARVFGFTGVDQPDVMAAFRSVGARDVAIGYGLWRAARSARSARSAQHGQDVAPWLLARLVCDTTDTVGCALAIGQGSRHPRFVALTGFAAVAAVVGAFLLQQSRADAGGRGGALRAETAPARPG